MTHPAETEFRCQCASAGFCPVFQRHQSIREHQICSGNALTPERQARYRAYWRESPLTHEGRTSITSRPPGGPGTELKRLLESLGIQPTGSCACDARAALMDDRGPEWCRENMDTIVSWLREEAERRGMPFVEFAVCQLIKLAILRAERAVAKARKTQST